MIELEIKIKIKVKEKTYKDDYERTMKQPLIEESLDNIRDDIELATLTSIKEFGIKGDLNYTATIKNIAEKKVVL